MDSSQRTVKMTCLVMEIPNGTGPKGTKSEGITREGTMPRKEGNLDEDTHIYTSMNEDIGVIF